mmetsp:Transcript_50363/g.99161  ORF Transcript_50363/g.99161 Transcript_50363/m.99161 type:complete len:144 (+) Transcript_50363:307-738(+)
MKSVVRRFYRELWEQSDFGRIGEILKEGVVFRGSLGDKKVGHAGFLSYQRKIHAALADYRCIEQSMVEDSNTVIAEMVFEGIHSKGPLREFPPSGKKVSWRGFAKLQFQDGVIANVYVLGDEKGLEAQLRFNQTQSDTKQSNL